MPIYEYKCKKCNQEFEILQRITEPEVKSCKFCKGPVQKLISRTTFHLKGTGWYVTDYSGKKAPDTGVKDESDKAASSNSGTNSTSSAKVNEE